MQINHLELDSDESVSDYPIGTPLVTVSDQGEQQRYVVVGYHDARTLVVAKNSLLGKLAAWWWRT